jgi:hypothetical protein
MSDVTLLTSIVETRGEGREEGLTFVNLSGEPHASAIVNAVAGNYERLTGRPKPGLDHLEAMVEQKVTLVLSGDTMLGGGVIVGREGKLFESQRGGVGILPKGKRTKGYWVDPSKVLDVFTGYAADEAASVVAEARAQYPELVNLTQERLEQLPGEDQGSDLSLALFGTHPLFGATDCVWLIGEYWPEHDICDRSVLLIRPEFGVSEHGSSYGADLRSFRAIGEIVGYEPISYSDAIGLCDLPFDEAIARVNPAARVAA